MPYDVKDLEKTRDYLERSRISICRRNVRHCRRIVCRRNVRTPRGTAVECRSRACDAEVVNRHRGNVAVESRLAEVQCRSHLHGGGGLSAAWILTTLMDSAAHSLAGWHWQTFRLMHLIQFGRRRRHVDDARQTTEQRDTPPASRGINEIRLAELGDFSIEYSIDDTIYRSEPVSSLFTMHACREKTGTATK